MRKSPARGELKRGRQKVGKSADHANYVRSTVYLKRETHRAAKAAVLAQEPPGELSDLVEQLLSDWLATTPRTRRRPPRGKEAP